MKRSSSPVDVTWTTRGEGKINRSYSLVYSFRKTLALIRRKGTKCPLSILSLERVRKSARGRTVNVKWPLTTAKTLRKPKMTWIQSPTTHCIPGRKNEIVCLNSSNKTKAFVKLPHWKHFSSLSEQRQFRRCVSGFPCTGLDAKNNIHLIVKGKDLAIRSRFLWLYWSETFILIQKKDWTKLLPRGLSSRGLGHVKTILS